MSIANHYPTPRELLVSRAKTPTMTKGKRPLPFVMVHFAQFHVVPLYYCGTPFPATQKLTDHRPANAF